MSPAEISQRLRHLSAEMIAVGTAMDYFGCFNDVVIWRGRELVCHGLSAKRWADEIDRLNTNPPASAGTTRSAA